MKIDYKEWMIFIVLMVGFAFMGLAGGTSGFFVFTGLGLIIWLLWRGRKLPSKGDK